MFTVGNLDDFFDNTLVSAQEFAVIDDISQSDQETDRNRAEEEDDQTGRCERALNVDTGRWERSLSVDMGRWERDLSVDTGL